MAVPPSGTTTPPLPAHTAPIDADGVYTDLAIHWSSKLVDLSVFQKSFAVIVTVIVSVIAIVIVWDCYCYWQLFTRVHDLSTFYIYIYYKSAYTRV